MRTSLNLSAIFRAIGVRDPRQALDLVDLVQPTVVVGDYSALGPAVLPPTSIFGGFQPTTPGDRAFNTLRAPPEGCLAVWSAFVGNATGTLRVANEMFSFHLREAATAYSTSVQWPGYRSGHQESKATLWGAKTLGTLPGGPSYKPTGAGAGVIYVHYLPGGWHLEVWPNNVDFSMCSEWTVSDLPVQPLPDSEIAATP